MSVGYTHQEFVFVQAASRYDDNHVTVSACTQTSKSAWGFRNNETACIQYLLFCCTVFEQRKQICHQVPSVINIQNLQFNPHLQIKQYPLHYVYFLLNATSVWCFTSVFSGIKTHDLGVTSSVFYRISAYVLGGITLWMCRLIKVLLNWTALNIIYMQR